MESCKKKEEGEFNVGDSGRSELPAMEVDSSEFREDILPKLEWID